MCAAQSYHTKPTIRTGVSHVAEHHPEQEVVASKPLLRTLNHWGHRPSHQHRWTGCSELSESDETPPTTSHPPYRRTFFDGSLSILGAPHCTIAPGTRIQRRPRPVRLLRRGVRNHPRVCRSHLRILRAHTPRRRVRRSQRARGRSMPRRHTARLTPGRPRAHKLCPPVPTCA